MKGRDDWLAGTVVTAGFPGSVALAETTHVVCRGNVSQTLHGNHTFIVKCPFLRDYVAKNLYEYQLSIFPTRKTANFEM